jgi:penicillin-binding protein 1A
MRGVGKPVAGKTGTTNDEKDAWFLGFSPDLAVGVYLGYDQPKPLGRGMTGGRLAAPVVRDFMIDALADKPAIPFRVPPGIQLVRINATTGLRAGPGDTNVILEAFKPGQAPPDSYSVIGYQDQFGQPIAVSPEAQRAVRSGTGGLY